MVFKRYASPFELFDNLLMTQTFSEYINTMLENVQDEQIEKWYLAGGGDDKTFTEYKEEILSQRSEPIYAQRVEDTLQDSLKILNMGARNESI